MATLRTGDVLLFAPDYRHSLLLSVEDALVVAGEYLEHPGERIPYFSHVGIMVTDLAFAQQVGTARESTLASVDKRRGIYVKSLALTEGERFQVQKQARKLYGSRYDFGLDVYLGLRYLWHGLALATRGILGVSLPDWDPGRRTAGEYNCSAYVKRVLKKALVPARYRELGLDKLPRYPSPEDFAVVPGALWRLSTKERTSL